MTDNVTVNGNEVAIVQGKATFPISDLAAGEYKVTVLFAGDGQFNASEKTASFKVSKVELPADENPFNVDGSKTVVSKAPTFSIKLPGDATGNLTIIIGGKKYIEPVVNGFATVKLTNVAVGTYEVTLSYSGDSKYAPIVKNARAQVVVDPKVVMKQSSVLYTGQYSVTVYGDNGKIAKNTDVIFYISGKKVKKVKTNSKGVATLTLPSKYLPNKKYTIKATTLGKTSSKTVVVKQILTLKTVNVKRSATKLVLTATLKKVNDKTLSGKQIKFYFNGKPVKTVKTNKKGVAQFTIKSTVLKSLKVGKNVTYKAGYAKTNVKKTAIVKK